MHGDAPSAMQTVRGAVSDRPWGLTLGALGVAARTVELTLRADDKVYRISFDRGMVIAATSPLPADAVARVALTSHLITPGQVNDVKRRLAAAPNLDEVDVLAAAVRLTPDQARALRLKLITQRAARTFSVDRGEYEVEDRTPLPVAEAGIDIRIIIYHGVRMNLSEQRLAYDLRQLGTRFALKPSAEDDLARFGFTRVEQTVVDELREGTSLPELEANHRELDPRVAQSVIYALASCEALVQTDQLLVPVGETPPPQLTRALTPHAPSVREPVVDSPSGPLPLPPPPAHPATAPPPAHRTSPGAPGGRVRPPATPPPLPPRAVAGPTTPVPNAMLPPPPPPPAVAAAPPRSPTRPPPTPHAHTQPRLRPAGATEPPPAPVPPPPAAAASPALPQTLGTSAGVPNPIDPHSQPTARAAVPRSMIETFRTGKITTVRPNALAAHEVVALIEERTAMLDDGADHFTLLGVPIGAPIEDVHAAYVELSRHLRPKRLAELGISDEGFAAQRLLAQIGIAFTVLTDRIRRPEYIASLQSARRNVAGTQPRR